MIWALVLLIILACIGVGLAAELQYRSTSKGERRDSIEVFRLNQERAKKRLELALEIEGKFATRYKNLLDDNAPTTTDQFNDLNVRLDDAGATAISRQQEVTQASEAYARIIRESVQEDMRLRRPVFIAAGVGLSAVVLGFIAIQASAAAKSLRARRDRLEATLKEDLAATQERTLEIGSLWGSNRLRIDAYHQLVMTYAESTRRINRIAILGGFAFLLLAATLALIADTVTSSVVVASIGVVGAAVTGYIAKPVLASSLESSQEISRFFAHPLQMEAFLAAERIANDLPSKSEEAKLLIIESLTRTKRAAGLDDAETVAVGDEASPEASGDGPANAQPTSREQRTLTMPDTRSQSTAHGDSPGA